MSALYNFRPDLSCPRCFRPAGSLTRPAVDHGLYRCGGCYAAFRREKATDLQPETLVHVIEEPWNAGARMADDVVCQCCGARGHSEVVCPQRCSQPERSYR